MVLFNLDDPATVNDLVVHVYIPPDHDLRSGIILDDFGLAFEIVEVITIVVFEAVGTVHFLVESCALGVDNVVATVI